MAVDKEDGFYFPYVVKKTTDKGLGVFADEAIKKGSIVWRHVPGQYIVYNERTFKAVIEKMAHADVVYYLRLAACDPTWTSGRRQMKIL